MNFIDYLKSQNIDCDTPGARGIIFATISSVKSDIEYREAALLFADIPKLQDEFEGLWYGYETELDRQIYEAHFAPKDAYSIVRNVLQDMIAKYRSKDENTDKTL